MPSVRPVLKEKSLKPLSLMNSISHRVFIRHFPWIVSRKFNCRHKSKKCLSMVFTPGEVVTSRSFGGSLDRRLVDRHYPWSLVQLRQPHSYAILWLGHQTGKTYQKHAMTDFVPTIAALLHIQVPSGSIGRVVTEALK